MSLDLLYQDIILEHYKNPRNFEKLDRVGEENVHENPTCGDSLKLDVKLSHGKVDHVAHESKGCAISVSSASMMSEFLAGKTREEALHDVDQFLNIFQGKADPEILDNYDDLASLKGVIAYPLRVKCATLAWHAVKMSLEKSF